MNQQSSPIKLAAADYALEFLPPEEKWDEGNEIEYNVLKSAFIAGSQWQAKQGDDTKKFIHEDGKTKTPYPIYPNEIRDEESSLGRFKGEPTPVKGDAYTKEDVSKAFEAGQSYEFWLQTRNALEEKDAPLAHDAYMRSITPKAAPKGDVIVNLIERLAELKKWHYVPNHAGDMGEIGQIIDKLQEYASQFAAPQAVKWVQASERLPDKPKPYHCKDNGRLKIYTLGDIKLLRDIAKIEWLDEGSTDKNET